MKSLDKLKDFEKLAYDLHFRWPNSERIFSQILSEIEEIRLELPPHKDTNQENKDRLQEEIGDLILATFCLCSFSGFDVSKTIDKTVDKYEDRLKALKNLIEADGLKSLESQDLETRLHYWKRCKYRDNQLT